MPLSWKLCELFLELLATLNKAYHRLDSHLEASPWQMGLCNRVEHVGEAPTHSVASVNEVPTGELDQVLEVDDANFRQGHDRDS